MERGCEMTARAAIKQSEIRRLAVVAKQEGVQIEVEIDGRVIRIAADNEAQKLVAKKEIIRL